MRRTKEESTYENQRSVFFPSSKYQRNPYVLWVASNFKTEKHTNFPTDIKMSSLSQIILWGRIWKWIQ